MSILSETKRMKINSISPDKHKYLQIVSTIAKVPETLYYKGSLPQDRIPSVAIIGSRKPTPYGKEVTYRLAYDLAKEGVIIISGLALGIDGIAHRATIDAGGTTLAILANGVDDVYPRAHHRLADDILNHGGAIISEYAPGTTARDFQFLARNRIVSGLADAIVVVEAARRSGTLSTVTHALEQGRDVFAVPGNITSVLSVGPNRILQQGAHVATSARDIIELIAPHLLTHQSELPLGDNPLETKIIQLLQSGMRDGTQLQQHSGAEVSDFLVALTTLEISGTIRPLGGNQWTIR